VYKEKELLTKAFIDKQFKSVNETLQRNTHDLNENLVNFIKLKNFTGILDSQVPTSLILTSSESASSIETQFEQLTAEIQQKVKAKCLVLDEKKCITTKNAIDHIITKLMLSFGVQNEKRRGGFEMVPERLKTHSESSGDEVELEIMEDPPSDAEMEAQEEEAARNSSNYVSTIRNPSFGVN
jgi:hypothetical protein